MLGLHVYGDEAAAFESKLERKEGPATNILRKVRKCKSKTKTKSKRDLSRKKGYSVAQYQFDEDSEGLQNKNETENVVFTRGNVMHTTNICEDFFEESKKKKLSDLAEDSRLITYGLDLKPEFVSEFVANRSARKEKIKSYYEELIENKDELEKLCNSDPSKYKRGILDIEASHKAKCFLTNCVEDDSVISISGRSNCGKTYSDDEVVIEIIGTEQITKEKIQMKQSISKSHRFGKVIGILKQNRCANMKYPVFICEIDEHEIDKAKPLCRTVPKFHLMRNGEQKQYTVTVYEYNNTNKELVSPKLQKINKHLMKAYLFYVVCLSWELQYPVGAIFKIHKSTQNYENCMKMLKLQHKLPVLYTLHTVEEAESISMEISAEMRENRFDLSSVNVFTIDPENAPVLDDAISIQHLENGEYIVGIHITDVASFVKLGSPLDNEAFLRGTTYFPGQFLNPHHMLPEPISKMVCSLLPGKERLTITVFLHFDKQKQFVLKKTQFCKSIMRSCCKLTYKEVQEIISNNDKVHHLREDIIELFAIAKQIRRKRLGTARFAFPVEVNLPGEKDTDCFEAYNLVEQFMILTNYVAGIELVKCFPDCVPLRCQDPPFEKRVAEWLQTYPQICDMVIDLQGQCILNERCISISNIEKQLLPNDIVAIQKWAWETVVQECKSKNFKEARNILCSDELHPFQALAINEWENIQQNASYRCSGFVTGTKNSHFTLGLSPYIHFTAPIRRYIDIVVQRLLHAAIDKKISPYDKNEIKNICSHITSVSKNGKTYQRRCKELILTNMISHYPLLLRGIVEDFSEQEISFIFPGLKCLPRETRILPLHTLLVSSAPQTLHDDASIQAQTGKSHLVLRWKKRIYSASVSERLPRPKNVKIGYQRSKEEYQKIDPYQKSIYKLTSTWIKFIQTLLSGATADQLERALGSDDIEENIPSTFDSEIDINSELNRSDDIESLDSHTMFQQQFCKFSHTFSHGQILELQLSAEMQNGFMKTNIDFLNLTNSIKFCTKHMRDPVGCLEHFSIITPRKSYSCSQDYKETWIPIVLMESASSVVKESSIIINDIEINFERASGSFVLSSGYCFERNIVVTQMSSSFLEKHKLKASKSDDGISDYMCIRCLVSGPKEHAMLGNYMHPQQYYWVSHAKIIRITKTGNETPAEQITIRFLLTNDELVPETLKDRKTVKCCIEILQKTESDK